MPVMASDIISRAQTVVQDTTGVRWPFAELLQWLNDGQREVALYKPSATAANVAILLQQGTLQDIGVGGLALLRVTRNLKTPVGSPRIGARATRIVSREVLDAQHPGWHDPDVFPYAKEIKHFCFDETDPTHFYVFPGNTGTGAVEAVISQSPPDIELASGADTNALTSYRREIRVPDIYANTLLDYVLFRAYSKDADYAGNADRSGVHYQMFVGALTVKLQNEAAINPNTGQTHGERAVR
jgi:hypothetical protein